MSSMGPMEASAIAEHGSMPEHVVRVAARVLAQSLRDADAEVVQLQRERISLLAECRRLRIRCGPSEMIESDYFDEVRDKQARSANLLMRLDLLIRAVQSELGPVDQCHVFCRFAGLLSEAEESDE